MAKLGDRRRRVVAVRAGSAGQRGPDQRCVRSLRVGGGTSPGIVVALLASQLCDPSDRGRLRRVVRATTVGHEYASTTAIYTSVSSDYKTRVLRAALDGAIEKAKRTGVER